MDRTTSPRKTFPERLLNAEDLLEHLYQKDVQGADMTRAMDWHRPCRGFGGRLERRRRHRRRRAHAAARPRRGPPSQGAQGLHLRLDRHGGQRPPGRQGRVEGRAAGDGEVHSQMEQPLLHAVGPRVGDADEA